MKRTLHPVYRAKNGTRGNPRMWMIVVLLILLIWPAPSRAQTPPTGGSTCPLDFKVLDQYPYVAEKVKQTEDNGSQCSALRSGFQMVASDYIRKTGYFLPPNGTSLSCLGAYRQQLMKQGVSDATNITEVCQLSSFDIDRGAYVCNGVQTAKQFEGLISDPALVKDLNLSCSQSLKSTTACGVCNAAVLKVTASLQQVVRGNNSDGSCKNFTLVYTAGIVNAPGPLDSGTALCLLYIRTLAERNGHEILMYSAVGLGGILLLFVLVVLVYCHRRRKTKEAERKARVKRTTDLLDSSRVPHSSVNWFTIDEIKGATANFHRDNLLGSGGYGNVYKGTFQDGSVIAVKRFKNCSPVGDANFVHEVEMISSVRHRHLVAIQGCCVDSSGTIDGHQRLIIYDYMPNGSLQDHLFSKKYEDVLDWPRRIKIAIGMAKGLAYLHHDALPAIIHRDIKASNILLDSDFNARLADFGLAKFTPQGVSHVTTKVAGTFGYVAPEYALYGQLTERSDVYSFGMVLLELITGRRALSTAGDDPPHTLLSDWVWVMVKQGMWKTIVDPELDETGVEDVMQRFINVALLCSHPQIYHRPTVGQALKMLESNAAVPLGPDRPVPLTSIKKDIRAVPSPHDGVNGRTGFSSGTASSSSQNTHSSSDPFTKSAVSSNDRNLKRNGDLVGIELQLRNRTGSDST